MLSLKYRTVPADSGPGKTPGVSSIGAFSVDESCRQIVAHRSIDGGSTSSTSQPAAASAAAASRTADTASGSAPQPHGSVVTATRRGPSYPDGCSTVTLSGSTSSAPCITPNSRSRSATDRASGPFTAMCWIDNGSGSTARLGPGTRPAEVRSAVIPAACAGSRSEPP